jgi:hypothetical protein
MFIILSLHQAGPLSFLGRILGSSIKGTQYRRLSPSYDGPTTSSLNGAFARKRDRQLGLTILVRKILPRARQLKLGLLFCAL